MTCGIKNKIDKNKQKRVDFLMVSPFSRFGNPIFTDRDIYVPVRLVIFGVRGGKRNSFLSRCGNIVEISLTYTLPYFE